MYTSKHIYRVFLLIMCLVTQLMQAGEITYHSRIPATGCTTVTIGTSCAKDSIEVLPKTGSFTDLSLMRVITLGVDHSNPKFLPDSFTCKVTLQIKRYDKNTTLIATTSKDLTVIYTPFSSPNPYLDKSAYFAKDTAYKVRITITTILVNGVSVSVLPENLYIDNEITVERYGDFASVASTPVTVNDTATINLDCNSSKDELLVSWVKVEEAEEYELEWTFVNDYGNDSVVGTYLSTSVLPFDFRYNSTRITTTSESYKITLAFEHGYLLYRVRAIGRDQNNPSINIVGVWNIVDSAMIGDISSSLYYPVASHEANKNWQYNASFAEEGKKKEVLGYFDGSLRSRQTVTKMNSDKNVLVGETVYDYQGRPAVNILPVPVTLPSCTTATTTDEPAIKYYSKFNQADSALPHKYLRGDFDKDYGDSCSILARGMSTSYGASNYYSSSNPIKTGIQAYLPDAEKYPFTQVQYTPDNTGRIKKQSGVGPQFQIGSEHETKYIYGQPNQLELDRMFGTETGDAAHYKKNIVIDANGQASVSYLDQQGRVIATSLAGAGDSTLDANGNLILTPLPSQTGAIKKLKVDLFAMDSLGHSNQNTVNTSKDAIVFNTQLTVAYTSPYEFNYNMYVGPYSDPFCSSSLCLSCEYNLQIKVTNDCGQIITPQITTPAGHNPVLDTIGHFTVQNDTMVFTVNCTTNTPSLTDTAKFTLVLDPGNYTVSKILTLNTKARDFYLQAYLDSANNTTCFKTQSHFDSLFVSKIDTSSCALNCSTCVASLGKRDDWVSSGKGTDFQYDVLLEQCEKPCKKRSICEIQFQQMLGDVSLDGQYGDYPTSGNLEDFTTFPVSVFNASSLLTKNIGTGQKASWRYPLITINGTDYNYYVNPDGNRSIVKLSQTIVSSTVIIYSPDVISTSGTLIQYDTTGAFWYTYPENLKYFVDFKASWDPYWANSLVQYHPEYCYYRTCQQYGIKQSGDSLSSDDFDTRLLNANTFADAITAGFIPSNYASITDTNQRVTDFFTRDTTRMYDPFLTNSVFQVIPSATYDIHDTLHYTFLHYASIGGANRTMVEFAASSAKCATNYGTTYSATCFDFGINISGLSTFRNDSIRNSEWNMFKNAYLSAKQKAQKKIQNLYALYPEGCGGFNGCIGNSSFNFSSAGMFINPYFSSPYFNALEQPCSGYTAYLYAHKQKRFVSGDDVPFQSSGEAEFQNFISTGQCPMAVELEYLLGSIASKKKLTASNDTLNNYFEFTPDLYNAFTVPNPSYNTYQYNWQADSTHADTLTVHIVNDSSNVNACTLTLYKTGSGINYWNDIVGFKRLDTAYTAAGPKKFTIVAVLNHTPDSADLSPYSYKEITGSSCLTLYGCQSQTMTPPTNCTVNDNGAALNSLMTALAANNQLTSSNVDLTTSTYSSFLNSSILKYFKTSSNLIWTYDSTQAHLGHSYKAFYIYDAIDSSSAIGILFSTYDPLSFTSGHLNQIRAFNDLTKQGSSSFKIDGFDNGDTSIVKITGNAFVLEQSGASYGQTAMLFFDCPIQECYGNEFDNRAQLQNIIYPVLSDQAFTRPYVPANIDLAKSTYYSNNINSFFPPGTLGTTAVLDSTVGVGSFSETMQIYSVKKIVNPATLAISTIIDSTSCPIKLEHSNNHDAAGKFKYLNGISTLTGTLPTDNYGNYLGFYFIASYYNGIGFYQDTVRGTSCIPLKNCACNYVKQLPYPEAPHPVAVFLVCDTIADTITSPTFTKYDNPCAQYQKDLAKANAASAYDQYKDSVSIALGSRYTEHCLAATEKFNVDFKDKQYHYTLYYYDQAGNLVRTVPPEGVDLLDTAKEQQIIGDRTYNRQTIFTNHTLPTTYDYNSLNQLVKQNIPDHDKMQVREYTLPSGLDSRLVTTATQFVDVNKGYLSGYIGSSPKRGYLYSTNDGGQTWQRLYDLVAANLNKIQMISSTDGYAVGNEGMLLHTADGANTWDIVPTYPQGIVKQLNDLYFTSTGNGVIVGSGIALKITSGVITEGTGIATGDTLTAVTYDAGATAYYACGNDLNNVGVVYKSTNGGTSWTLQTSYTSVDLNKVHFLQSPQNTDHGFAAGIDGTLLQTKNSGTIWNNISTGTTRIIRDLFFANDTIGVAIMDSAATFGQIYMTSDSGRTWNLLSKKGEYFNAMSFYFDNSSGTFKGVAVGNKGVVRRIVATLHNASPYFGIMNVNFPVSTIDLKAVYATYAKVSGNDTLNIMVAGNNGNIYYTAKGGAPTVTWTAINTLTTLPANTSGNSNFKNLQFRIKTDSNFVRAAVLTTTGKEYSIQQHANGVFRVFATATSGSYNFTALENTGGLFYSLNTVDNKLYSINVPNSGTPSTSAITGTNSAIATATSFDIHSTDKVTVVGPSGSITQSNGLTSTITWTTQSTNTRPLPLSDIEYNGTSNNIYAVGNDGSILQTTTGSSWKSLASGTAKKLNAIKFNTTTTGLIAGDMGELYTHSISGSTITLTAVSLSTIINTPAQTSFSDIALDAGGAAFITGDKGTVVYISDISSPITRLGQLKPLNVNFKGVSFLSGSTTNMIAVGNGSAIYNYASISGARIKEIFTPGINALHFTNAGTGFIVGDEGTIRSTTTGGNSWQLVQPQRNNATASNQVPDLLSVWTVSANNAIVGGNGNYLGQKVASSDSTVNVSSYAYTVASSNKWKDIQFHPYFLKNGYTVGANKLSSKISLNNSGTITSVTAITPPTGTFDFNAVHVFRDNTFMAVGSAGQAQFYDGSWLDQSPSSYSNATFNDVFFHDDRTGYLAGDSITTGVLLKCVSAVNIQDLVGTLSWNYQSLKDGFNITSNANANLNVVSFSDRYHGLVAGEYASGFTNTSAIPYVRLLHDEADLFSTSFFHDRLGRLVVSQNTKQFNKIPTAYSYTKYDALGRITEVGEKAENSNGHKFKNIFGESVNNFYNPRVVNDDSLNTWIASTGARTEVTHTYYDTIQYASIPVVQQNLRKRVASTTFENVDDNDRTTFNFATHYSYDIHGNVNTLIQDDSVSLAGQRFKRMDYLYDLVSGNVNQVSYQSGRPDRFYHRYVYDADNRIKQVWTSKDSILWDNDAKYWYYAHGPLARTELGDVCSGLKIQGIDYAYTLQGWVKAVNSNLLKVNNDMGHDGDTTKINRGFAHDAFGYSLNYFNKDYTPIGTLASTDSAIATLAGSDLLKAQHSLFNGNISSMVTSITKPTTYTSTTGTPTILPQGTGYKYDQLNRIVEMQAYKNLVVDSNKWGLGSTYAGMYNNKFTYDGNGNILTQQRRDSAGKMINALTYNRYNVGGRTLQNRLYMVDDTVASGRFADDIDDQGTFDNTSLANVEANNNYKYDELGSLNHNTQKEIDTIKYSVYGKVKEVIRTSGSAKKNLKFDYDASGNRIAKHVYTSANVWEFSEYYVKDATGNVMSIYKKTNTDFAQTEKNIYGSSRVGIDRKVTSMIGATLPTDTAVRYLGNKYFELSNHLGNVLSTVSDKKIPRGSGTTLYNYEPEIASATDYYPFGVAMKKRTFNDTINRYKFNGKEFDAETETSDFGDRNEDADLVDWNMLDKAFKNSPGESPYSVSGNSPIALTDIGGRTKTYYITLIDNDGKHQMITVVEKGTVKTETTYDRQTVGLPYSQGYTATVANKETFDIVQRVVIDQRTNTVKYGEEKKGDKRSNSAIVRGVQDNLNELDSKLSGANSPTKASGGIAFISELGQNEENRKNSGAESENIDALLAVLGAANEASEGAALGKVIEKFKAVATGVQETMDAIDATKDAIKEVKDMTKSNSSQAPTIVVDSCKLCHVKGTAENPKISPNHGNVIQTTVADDKNKK